MFFFAILIQGKAETNEKSRLDDITGDKPEKVHVLNFGIKIDIIRTMKSLQFSLKPTLKKWYNRWKNIIL